MKHGHTKMNNSTVFTCRTSSVSKLVIRTVSVALPKRSGQMTNYKFYIGENSIVMTIMCKWNVIMFSYLLC